MNINRKLKYLTITWLLLTLSATAGAAVHYSCDFEDAQQRQHWVLNPGSTSRLQQCPNKWMIGVDGNFSEKGHFGLMISNDSAHAVYSSSTAMYIAAYDTINLAAGTYTLDFDWRMFGNGASTKLYVAWMPLSQSANCNTTGTANWFDPTKTNTYCISGPLYGQRSWKPQRVRFTVDAATANGQGKLCFVFATALDYSQPKPPSACVDNITICDPSSCTYPTNLKYNESKADLTWSGRSGMYQLRDYCVYDGSLTEYDSLQTTTWHAQLNGEGTHVFYIRSVCGDGSYSEWVATSHFVWIPGMRCLDYMDLNNSKVCDCYTGSADAPSNYNAFQTRGVVSGQDKNWATGSHTLHTDPEEKDPNTDNELYTVPEGELMSVRLGNSQAGSGAEGIIYKMTIPKGESRILKLKYALVLEDGSHDLGGPEAGPHTGNEQSHFYVEIRDQYGKPQGLGCTTFDFSCDPSKVGVDPTWHTSGTGYNAVVWKEWTEVSISLVAFQGQNITIRLSNYDCTASGHYGYAYFAMGCVDGGLEGVACGDFSTDHFTAPADFHYRWYKEGEPNVILSTEQTLNISPTTDSIYLVDVINPINDCFYTLTANPNPRFPKAVGDTTITHTDCKNMVTFTNESYIRVVNRKDGSDMSNDEPIYTVDMEYGDGVKESVRSNLIRHEYPLEGGHFVARMIASMNDGICQDTLTYEFDLPDILHTGTDEYVQICRKTQPIYVLPDGGTTDHDTAYVSYIPNQYGCEAPYYLYVTFSDQIDVELFDTICQGQVRVFEGDSLTETGSYSKRYELKTGCDSVITLNLYVIPHMAYYVSDTVEICGDNGAEIHIPYDLGTGQDQYLGVEVFFDTLGIGAGFDSSYVFGPEQPIVIPIPDYVRPNYYPIRLQPMTPRCPVEDQAMTVVVHYTSAIFDQLDGFIGLLNDRFNYGEFEYLTYRWYRDGELMPNDTLSYVHTTMDDLKHLYWVEVTRADDGVVMTSCPVEYTGQPMGVDAVADGVGVWPTLVEGGAHLTVTGRGMVRVVDLLGRTCEQFRIGSIGNASVVVNAPRERGVYFVVFENHDAVKIIVR